MKVLLDRDIILRVVSPIHPEGVEIGDQCLPNLSRFRWDGQKVVDILQLDEIWLDDFYVPHCKNIGRNWELVKVDAKYRKKLMKQFGVSSIRKCEIDVGKDKEV